MEAFLIKNFAAIITALCAVDLLCLLFVVFFKKDMVKVITAIAMTITFLFAIQICYVSEDQKIKLTSRLHEANFYAWDDTIEIPGKHSSNQVFVESMTAKTWKGLMLCNEKKEPLKNYGDFAAFDCIIFTKAPSCYQIDGQDTIVCCVSNGDEFIEVRAIPRKDFKLRDYARFVGFTCGKIKVGDENRKLMIGVLS